MKHLAYLICGLTVAWIATIGIIEETLTKEPTE